MKGKRVDTGLHRLKDLLPELLSQWHLDVAHRITCVWPQVVGENISRVSRPREVRRGQRAHVLVVEVQSPSWAQELTLLRDQFLERYRSLLPDVPLADIRFEVRTWFEGEPLVSKTIDPAPAAADEPGASLLNLTPQEIEELEGHLASAPESLRPVLRNMLLHQARVAKTRLAAGWKPCATCHVLHPEAGDRCRLCETLDRSTGPGPSPGP